VSEPARSLAGEVLVAYNGPEAGDAVRLQSEIGSEEVRVLHEPVPGKSNALNRAVREARGAVIAFTDDDALPDREWLPAITAPLTNGESSIAGCGGAVLPIFPAGGAPPWFRRLLSRMPSTCLGPLHFLGNGQRLYENGHVGVPMPFGANCAYRRAVLLAHPFKSNLGPNYATGLCGGEDTELAHQLLRNGSRLLYVPEARVYHPVEPRRMTLEFVRERYHTLGREATRVRRAIGEPIADPERLARKIRAHVDGPLRRWIQAPRRTLRRELRRTLLEGELLELRA